MILMESNNAEELTAEQKATLEAIEAENKPVEEIKTPEPVVETPKVEEVKPAEEVKEEVMPLADPDADETEVTDGRQPKFVRLEKHIKMRDKMKEMEAELMALKSKPNTEEKQEETLDEIKSFAEANGYDEDQTKKLVELAEKGAYSRLEKQFAERFNQLEQVAEKAKRDNLEVEQEKIWNKQFAELQEKFSSEKEHIESIKDQIKRFAYTKEFHKTPLSAVYAYLKEVEGLKPTDKSKTVESGTGGSNTGGIDYQSILANNDEEAIKRMNSEEFQGLQDFIKKNNY